MADDLFAFKYGNWDDDIWIDQSVTPEVTAAAGSGNDLSLGLGIGGEMTGDVTADGLSVVEPYPGLGSVEFDGTVSVTADAFELSVSSTMGVGPGLVIDGGALITDSTLIVGQGTTLEVSGGGAIDSSGAPGLQDFGEIDVNVGSVNATGQLSVFGTFDLISGSGTVATLVVGSYSGEAGFGGTGELEIAAGNTITVSDALAVAVQTGTGEVAINGGVLIVNGAADVGEAGEPGTAGGPGIGSLTIAAAGSLSVSDTLDIGVSSDGVGSVVVAGDASTASLGGLVVGDAGNGTLTLNSGAKVTTSDDVVIGNSAGGTGSVTVSGDDTLLDDGGGLTVGAAGAGTIAINQGSVEVSAGAITLGQSAKASGTLTLASSSLNLSGTLLVGDAGSGSLSVGNDGTLQAQNIALGEATNGSGTLSVGGDGAGVQSSTLTIGAGGSGTMEVSEQGSLDTTGAAVLGTQALPSVQQQAAVNGAAQWTVGSGLTVGKASSAALAITSGGQVFAGSVVLGDQTGAAGTVTVSGTVSSASGTVVSSLFFGGELVVGNAGTATLDVSQGGVVGSPTLAAGTVEVGAASGGVGTVSVSGVGSSLNAAVLAVGGSGTAAGGAGMLSIGAGATADAGTVTVWSNGTIALSGGHLMTDPITVRGEVSGYGTIAGGIVDDGTILADGGALSLSGGLGGSGTLAFGGVATLVLGTPGSGLAQAVTGLAFGDRIELAGLTITGAQVTSPGTVTVSTSGASYLLNDVSFATGTTPAFVTGQDAITGDDYIQVACFAAGTRIASPHGELAVEDLCVGDCVSLAPGGAAQVMWIGRRSVDATRHPAPGKVWPVRIAAGSFAVERPQRDLLLSPDHAVFIEDVLIPVKCLINGSTIMQVAVDTVTYYHIELPSHDVVLAEGLPVESYLDTGQRSDFGDGGINVRLHPEFNVRAWEALGCAPLVVTGPALDSARRLVNSRAAAMALTGTPPARAA
jgi:T5SS/PEP-CTERM-associated repeat protein